MRPANSIWHNIFSDDFFKPAIFERPCNGTTPAVNILETEKGFMLEVAAPGLEKEDFKVRLDKDNLSISVEKESKTEETEGKYSRREFSYSSWERSFKLPETLDKQKIDARYENGVLFVNLPKLEEAVENQARDIDIS